MAIVITHPQKRLYMKRILSTVIALSLFTACSTNSVTGRKQLKLFPEETLQQQAITEYRSFLSQNKVLSSNVNKDAEMVNRVGNRIAKAITDYYTQKGLASELNGYKWEFNLVESKEVNAWCMPGGKVVVYTGLLGITQNEAALAVVMGHEIAHAIARHGNERMSQAMAVQGIGMAAMMSTKPSLGRDILLQSYGVGTGLGMLAYSRNHESEADKMGLVFMAMAGYDPRNAPQFWKRMAEQGGGQKPPEILSTHPSDERRIADLEAYMPEAMKYYKPQ